VFTRNPTHNQPQVNKKSTVKRKPERTVCVSLPRAINVPSPNESECRAWMLIFYIALSALLPSQHKKSSADLFFSIEIPQLK